jgi:membrane-associated phospholipid phosphatase
MEFILQRGWERKMHALAPSMNAVRWLQSHLGPEVHPFFLGVTFLGASAVLWGLLALYCWLVEPRFGRRLAIVFALSILTNQTLKEIFGTARPYDLDAALSTDWARRTGMGPGFPSGHASNAATFWFAFAFRCGRLTLWLAAAAIVGLVALSRLYLGVHLPVDVLGGLVLGCLFAWVAGGWSGPRAAWTLNRRIGIPLLGIAGLALALLGANPWVCGLLAGAVIAQPDVSPPRDARRRVCVAVGGLAALALFAVLLLWLPDRLHPGLSRTAPMGYLAGLVLSLVGLDLWPRVCSRWSVRS